METVSKNRNRGRGRPRTILDDDLTIARYVAEPKTTLRHLHNVHYRTRAIRFLAEDPSFSWVCDGPAMQAGKAHAWKPTILSELGRIANLDDMRAVAKELCQKRPKTKDAVAMIRRFRTGVNSQGDVLKLAETLERTINDYLQHHPAMSWKDIRAALVDVLEAVHDTEEQEAA